MKEENKFVGYEYKEVSVRSEMESLWIDSYESFGWMLDGQQKSETAAGKSVLKFKRDRKIINKPELTRLQRQYEDCVHQIEYMENQKKITASVAAYVSGFLGTGFMAGSVFCYIGGLLLPSVLLAFPAFLGWILAYVLYIKIGQKKARQLEPVINQQYDKIYETCERAASLIP